MYRFALLSAALASASDHLCATEKDTGPEVCLLQLLRKSEQTKKTDTAFELKKGVEAVTRKKACTGVECEHCTFEYVNSTSGASTTVDADAVWNAIRTAAGATENEVNGAEIEAAFEPTLHPTLS